MLYVMSEAAQSLILSTVCTSIRIRIFACESLKEYRENSRRKATSFADQC